MFDRLNTDKNELKKARFYPNLALLLNFFNSFLNMQGK